MTSFSSTLIAQNPAQLSIQDYIDLSEQNANKEWLSVAIDQIEKICRTLPTFTADDVHTRMDTLNVKTKDNSAMGAVMQHAKKHGWCVWTGTYVASERQERHGSPVKVWRSLLLTQS
jgi:hypothetical protein